MLCNDVIFLIGLELKLEDIINYSCMNKKTNTLIGNNYSFWYSKIEKDFRIKYTGQRDIKKIKHYYNIKLKEQINLGLEEAARLGDKKLVDFFILKGADDWDSAIKSALDTDKWDLFDFFMSKGANNY